jgi:hypothetical protein
MGAAGSVRQYKTLLKGQTPVAKKLHWFVSTLGLEDGEAASLLALYRRADAKKRGSVSWQEYAECLLLDEYHPYSKRFFDSLNDGDDGNDNLDCLEFFVGVYRWCTMSPREIMGYTFHLYAGEAGLEIDHLKTMLKEIHFISKVEKTSKSVLAGHVRAHAPRYIAGLPLTLYSTHMQARSPAGNLSHSCIEEQSCRRPL